jgi:hypothetical protein
MRPFTPWGGVDSPSKSEVFPCLGFWFLNPSACQVCLHCIVYHVISYSCLEFYLRNLLFYPHIFSSFLEKHLQIFFWGWQLKHVGGLLFCLGISKPLSIRTSLVLPYIILFQKKKKKKNWGEDAELYFFLLIAFQILHVFLPDISVHCAMIKYAYIWLRVYAWYLLSFPVASKW